MRPKLVPAGSDSWSVRIELPPGLDGRRRQRRFTFQGRRAEAQAAYDQVWARLIRGELTNPGRATVSDLLERWLDSRAARVERSTLERYRAMIDDQLRPVLGSIKLSALSPHHIEDALKTWRKMPRRDRKTGVLSQRTLHHLLSTLRSVLRMAVNWELIPRNPCDRIDPIERGGRTVVGLAPPDVAPFFERLRGAPVFLPALVAAFGGFRRGELLALHWSDLDLATGSVDVERALEESSDGTLSLKAPKTDKSRRRIVLPAFVLEVLRTHRQELVEIFGEDRLPRAVFPDVGTGGYWRPDAFSSAFYYTVRSRGLQRISFHGLRHTYNTLMQDAGVDVVVRSHVLGHSDIGVTGNVYGHVPALAVFNVARLLDARHARSLSASSRSVPP